MFNKKEEIELICSSCVACLISTITYLYIKTTKGFDNGFFKTVLSYDLKEYAFILAINLIPFAWVLTQVIYIVSEYRKDKNNLSVKIEKGNVTVSTKKRKNKKKIYSEETFTIKMQVKNLGIFYGITASDDDDLDDEEIEYNIELVSPTKINGEQVSLTLENEKLYDRLKLGQILEVNLTVSLDRKGNEVDRRFEFVL